MELLKSSWSVLGTIGNGRVKGVLQIGGGSRVKTGKVMSVNAVNDNLKKWRLG